MPPTLIGVIHTDAARRAVDFGDEGKRCVDREALAHPEGRAGKAAGAEGQRLQILDELVVVGRGEAEGGRAEVAAAPPAAAEEAEGAIIVTVQERRVRTNAPAQKPAPDHLRSSGHVNDVLHPGRLLTPEIAH